MGRPDRKTRQIRQEHRELAARYARSERLTLQAQRTEPAEAPLRWRADAFGWLVAALLLANIVRYSHGAEPIGTGILAYLDWLAFQVGATLIWAWLACGAAGGAVVADSYGLWVRTFWSVRRVPWEQIDTIEALTAFGQLFIKTTGPDDHLGCGLFAPSWLRRLLRVPDSAQTCADRLTIMAHHPHLRPSQPAPATHLGPAWLPYPVLLVWAYTVVLTFLR